MTNRIVRMKPEEIYRQGKADALKEYSNIIFSASREVRIPHHSYGDDEKYRKMEEEKKMLTDVKDCNTKDIGIGIKTCI